MEPKEAVERLKLLREDFLPNQVSKLPKGTKAQNECPASDKKNCSVCGGWHHPKIIHLDYVGHAAITDRLLSVDPFWSWDFLSVGPDGYPVLDKDGGMWIKLTVCGVTRLGYGDAQGKSGANATKERIGDALRNAAMRFGAALDLWHKGELHIGGWNASPGSLIPSQGGGTENASGGLVGPGGGNPDMDPVTSEQLDVLEAEMRSRGVILEKFMEYVEKVAAVGALSEIPQGKLPTIMAAVMQKPLVKP